MAKLNPMGLLQKYPVVQCLKVVPEEDIEVCREDYSSYVKMDLMHEFADFLYNNRSDLIEETSVDGNMREYRLRVFPLSPEMLRDLLLEAYDMGAIATTALMDGWRDGDEK